MLRSIFSCATGCVMAGLITAGAAIPVAAQAPSSDIREIRKTEPLSSDGTVSIEAFKGSITVKASDRAEVDILARIEPAGLSGREREAVNMVEVRIRAGANSVDIRSDYEDINDLQRNWQDNWDGGIELPFVHYTISMPRSANLYIKDFKSEINITGLSATVRVDSHKGPMTIADIKGDLRIDAYKGRVRITGLDGSLDLNTQKSDVEIDFARLSSRTRIESFKGDVQITLPKEAKFELDADVGHKGDFRSDFGLNIAPSSRGRYKSHDYQIRGEANGGGPLLSLRTTKGYYRLRQR